MAIEGPTDIANLVPAGTVLCQINGINIDSTTPSPLVLSGAAVASGGTVTFNVDRNTLVNGRPLMTCTYDDTGADKPLVVGGLTSSIALFSGTYRYEYLTGPNAGEKSPLFQFTKTGTGRPIEVPPKVAPVLSGIQFGINAAGKTTISAATTSGLGNMRFVVVNALDAAPTCAEIQQSRGAGNAIPVLSGGFNPLNIGVNTEGPTITGPLDVDYTVYVCQACPNPLGGPDLESNVLSATATPTAAPVLDNPVKSIDASGSFVVTVDTDRALDRLHMVIVDGTTTPPNPTEVQILSAQNSLGQPALESANIIPTVGTNTFTGTLVPAPTGECEVFFVQTLQGATSNVVSVGDSPVPDDVYVVACVTPGQTFNWTVNSPENAVSVIETGNPGNVLASGASGATVIPAGITAVSVVSDVPIVTPWNWDASNNMAVESVKFVHSMVQTFFMNNTSLTGLFDVLGDGTVWPELTNIQIKDADSITAWDLGGDYPSLIRVNIDGGVGPHIATSFVFPTEVTAPNLQELIIGRTDFATHSNNFGTGQSVTIPPWTTLDTLQMFGSSAQTLSIPTSVTSTLTLLSINNNDIAATDIDAILGALAAATNAGSINYGSQVSNGHEDIQRTPPEPGNWDAMSTNGWVRTGGY